MKAQNHNGYAGKILEVDLEKESFEKLELNSKWVELYVGGGGYATRILYCKRTRPNHRKTKSKNT
ncbi:MAG: hypothetical protein ABSB40_05815 [Nitrososphaeria archaeon]|jgi:aldehyde:ferredoxin oxidoreductase